MAFPLFVLYPLYAGVMRAKQAAILFPAAHRVPHGDPIEVPAPARLVEVPVSFGHARAVYWPSKARLPAPAIWYAHGNFETVADSFALVQPLLALGYAVLQFEFPGYSGSDGAPRFDQVSEAAERTWDWLAAQPGVDARPMVAMGYSIGAAPPPHSRAIDRSAPSCCCPRTDRSRTWRIATCCRDSSCASRGTTSRACERTTGRCSSNTVGAMR